MSRILLGHALIAAFGGIPLIHMGDEIEMLNDASLVADPDLCNDGRWMHRPRMDWGVVAAPDAGGLAARIHQGTRFMLTVRRSTPELEAWMPTRILDLGHPMLFIFERTGDRLALVYLSDFTESDQIVIPWALHRDPARRCGDHQSGQPVVLLDGLIRLPPLGVL